MVKLTLMVKGKRRSEWELQGKQLLIGRGADCEVRLDDPSVSRHHAKVARIRTGYCVSDMQSTNGVSLNGRWVRKHMVKNGDTIQVGNHELLFEADQVEDVSESEEVDASLSPQASHRKRMAAPPPSERAGGAYVRFLSGPDQGNSKRLDRTLFTIGQPGGELAVISCRAQGHFLMHLGGEAITTRNDEPIHGAGVELSSGDVIQVGDIRLEFYHEP